MLAAVIFTVTFPAVCPPGPEQVRVKVVFAEIVGLVAVPLVAWVPVKVPDQLPPEATQLLAPVVVQMR